MSLVFWMWVASVLSAVGFVAAGYLWGARSTSAGRPSADGPAPLVAELRTSLSDAMATATAAQADRDRLAAEQIELLEEQRDLVEERDRCLAERISALEAAETCRHERDAARSQLAEMESALQTAVRDGESSNRHHLVRLEERVAELESDLAARTAALDRAQLEVSQLQSAADLIIDREAEMRRLQQALEEVQHELAEIGPLRQMTADHRALQAEVEALRQRQEPSSQADELALLQVQNAEIEERLAAATEEIDQLRALRLAQWPVPPPSPANGQHSSVEAAIVQVARTDGHRATVVADEMGFLVGGFGEYQEPLAALCSIIADVHRRASALLPLGSIRRTTLETELGVTVSACSSKEPDVNIMLATLTVGDALQTSQLRQILREVSDTLRRREPAQDRQES